MKRIVFAAGIAGLVGLVGVASGCEEQFNHTGADASAIIKADAEAQQASLKQFNGDGVGATCKADGECRPGLKCASGKCAPRGDKKANDSCVLSDECGKDLQCGFFGFCVPSGGAGPGEQCTSTSDCKRGLFCLIQGIAGQCSNPTSAKAGGQKDIGGKCKATEDCLVGLTCSTKDPKNPVCQPGSVTLNPDLYSGTPCPELEEKGLPFQARSVVPRPISQKKEGAKLGERCEKTDDCYWHLLCKKAEEEVEDEKTGEKTKQQVGRCRVQSFYSTPFPNNVRINGKGFVDISDHPIPGPGVVGLDLTANVVKAINSEMRGFSVAPSVIFRFTRPVDEKSLVPANPAAVNPKSNIFFVNLDTGKLVAFTANFKAARNKYICANWLVIQAVWGYALHGNTNYAVYITDRVRAEKKEGDEAKDLVPRAGDDLSALLADASPSDPLVKAAHGKYAALRKYLKSAKVAIPKVVAATVFTTQDPTRSMRLMRGITNNAATKTPVISNFVVCSAATKGKTAKGCESQGAEAPAAGKLDPRGCPGVVSKDYTEIHARIRVPMWQSGGRPYLIGLFGSKGGGGLKRNETTGVPQITGYEDVCVAMSIPKQKAPPGGFPVVIYGHGTGGSHRSGIVQMAKSISGPTIGNGKRMVVLGWDQPMHGPRRFPLNIPPPLKVDPGPLFYNFANPPAAKGNFYQGAADLYSLARFVRTKGTFSVGGVGTIKLDPKNTYFMGHSQGGTTGPLALAWEPDYRGAVFSGTGGGLVFSLLNKKSPKDATVGVQIALQEADLDEFHPVLALMQYYFDEVDPLAFGHLYYHDIARRCGDKAGGAQKCTPNVKIGAPQHILHTFGTGDTYTPPQTSAVFAASTRGQGWNDPKVATKKLKPDPYKDLKMAKVSKMPAKGNLKVKNAAGKTQSVTGVTVVIVNRKENATNGKPYDGHFVAFKDKTCHKQVISFLSTIQGNGTPSVPDK